MIFATHTRRFFCILFLCLLGLLILLVPRDNVVMVVEMSEDGVVAYSDALHLGRFHGGGAARDGSGAGIVQQAVVQSFCSNQQRKSVVVRSKRAFGGKQQARVGGSDCFPATTRSPSSSTTTTIHGELRIACVGDSITFGNGTHAGKRTKKKHGGGNFPMTLARILDEWRDTRIDTDGCADATTPRAIVRNFGVNGATASDAKKKFSYRKHSEFRDALKFQPHVVVLMLGTNDIKSTLWKSKSAYERDLLSLVEEFRSVFTPRSYKLSSSAKRRNNKQQRQKQQQQQQQQKMAVTTTESSDSNFDGINNNSTSPVTEPWVLLMTPPPIAKTKQTIEWDFQPDLLQSGAVPVIRKLAKQERLGLIDLNAIFVPPRSFDFSPAKWTCPPSKHRDDDSASSSSSSSSSAAAATIAHGKVDSTFKCLFRDGVHPNKEVHSFIAHTVANAFCESTAAF